MASEAGVLPMPGRRSARRAACSPASMFLVDTAAGPHHPRRGDQAKSAGDAALSRVARRAPGQARATSPDAPTAVPQPDHEHAAAPPDRLRLHLRGPAHHPRPDGPRRRRSRSARWATTRRSPCSRTSRSLLYDYFKQLFAQVTNPPIDSYPRGNHHLVGDAPRLRGQPAQSRAAQPAAASS